jgi:hypothetical protein
MEKDGEKNIIVKIHNVKTTLRIDVLNLLKVFFTEGFPYYSEDCIDLPNQYDPNEDNQPAMRVYLEIRKPLISILTETMINHDQDVICLSTDLVLLYKKEKISRARKDLYKNYCYYYNKLSTCNEKDKKLLEKDIFSDSKDIYLLTVWLYDICPYVCNLNDILNLQKVSNFVFPKRKLMNYFNFNFENKTVLQYSHPHNYIQSFKTHMDINRITLKISYRDLVLFLKAAEFNSSIMDNNYTEKINNMTNQDRRGNKNVLTENEMNPIEGNNITRASELLRSSKKISLTKRITEKEQKCSKNDVVIDKGMGTMELETSGLQIVI